MRPPRQSAALIDSWFELLPLQQQPTARELHVAILTAVPRFELLVRGGALVYALGGVHVMALAPFRTHMHVQVFRGAELAAQFPELHGANRGMRHLRLRHGQQLDALLVDSLARAAALHAARQPAPLPAHRGGADADDESGDR
jgi:hypothetical protein